VAKSGALPCRGLPVGAFWHFVRLLLRFSGGGAAEVGLQNFETPFVISEMPFLFFHVSGMMPDASRREG
jgi:hypothetical protein